MNKIWTILALPAALLSATPRTGFAIAARHDRPESLYVERAAPLAGVGSIVGLFTGTLVRPRWVLTAAHAAEVLQRLVPDPENRLFTLGGKTYVVDAVFKPEGRARRDENGDGNAYDIALLRLATSVPGPGPVEVFDGEVLGAEVVVAGIGSWCADGRSGVPVGEVLGLPRGKLRAGTNRVDRVDEERNVMVATFDDPAGDAATELECGLGTGDSGGPLLVETDDGWAIAGVISSYENSSSEATGTYGDRIVATRVSVYEDWIQQTTEKYAQGGAPAMELPDDGFPWPDTPAGQRARAYFAALNADTYDPMRAFVPINWSPEDLERRSLVERLSQQKALYFQFGKFTPVEVRDATEWTITVLADAPNAPHRMALRLELDPEPPHYAKRTSMAPAR